MSARLLVRQKAFIPIGLLCVGSLMPMYAADIPNRHRPITQQVRAKIMVNGTITDHNGEPLIGATVREVASGNGTITDMDGKFTLSIPSDAVLDISYIGFKPKQIKVDGQTTLAIQLEEDSETLNEVVVVGYGVLKKVNLSGSVDQVSAKQLEARPIQNISKGLQGMVSNLNIDFTNGEPGQAAKINIRGEASINGGSPLILIDGVASDSEELNRLLPEDIESLSVLKDASSAAIYGARAAFGVILITTKQGGGDRIKVSYNNSFTWKHPTTLPDKTSDPYIYLKLKNIAVLNTPWSSGHVASDERLEWARQRSDDPSGTDPVRLDPLDETQWEYMGNRNWTNYFLDKFTFSQTHQLAISGSSEKTRFYISGGVDDENGILSGVVNNDNYRRYSMRAKVSYDLWKWLTFSNNTSYVATDRVRPSYMDMSLFYNLAPTDWDVNPDGTWANNDAGRAMAKLNDGGEETTKYGRLQSTFSAEMNFWDRMLRVNANFTFMKGAKDYDWYKNKYIIGYGPDDLREEGTSRAWKSTTNDYYSVMELFATFNKGFDRHDVTGILGFNQEYNRSDYYYADHYDIISTSLPNIALASGDQYVGETYKDWAIRGLFFRANYTYDSRYIFEVNGRYDGSSRFPKDKRYGFFPSASAAWRLDAEPFFASLQPVISQLKLRASYGSLGNQLVGEYDYIPTLSSQQGSYIIDGKLQQTVLPPSLVSSDYTWEEVRTINGGIDIGLLNNKLTATADVYRRDTKGMLTLGKELPGVLGATEPKENAADMKTVGWELTVGYRDAFKLNGKPFNWGARFLLSDNRSWITKFDNSNKSLTQYYEGQEIGEIWGLQSDGLFRNADEIAALDETAIIPWGSLEIVNGWPKYKDLNGDHKITKGNTTVNDPGDLSVIGNKTPRFRFGFNLNAEWNGFDLSAFFQGIAKRDYYPESFLYWSFYQQPYAGGALHTFDFYRGETDNEVDMAKHSKSYIAAGLADQNLDAKYPVLQSWLADKNLGTAIDESMGLAIPQTNYLLNGAYLRVKNITVGYTFPTSLTRKIGVSRLRLFVSGDNLYEWSALKKYFDPEAITDESSFGYVYPFNRQYMFGMNVTF